MKSTFNFGEVTLEFLKAFQEVQFELQCECSMNTIETYSRVKEFQKLQILYRQHVSSQKNHFLKFYQIFQKFIFHKNIGSLNFDISQDEIFADDHRRIPTISQFSNYVTNITDANVIEFLTYSTIPAYFSYFCTTFDVDNLVQFFTHIIEIDKNHEKKYFDVYARSIFVSPFFLSFITFALQPFFSSCLYKNLSSNDLDQIILHVKKHWRDKIHYLPKFAYDIIKISPNPAQTISKAFFEIALKNINDYNSFLQIYLLIYIGQFPSKEYLSIMSSLFTYSSENNILDDLVQIMFDNYNIQNDQKMDNLLENSFDDDFFFNDEDKKNAPSLFQPFLFSTIDYAVIDFITGATDTFTFPNVYRVYNCFHENETVAQSIHNINEMTMDNDSLQVKAALRHLLQVCDTIPIFHRVPDGLTVEDFFNIYLVNKGPIESLSKRIELAKVVQLICTYDNPQKIISHLYETVLDRTKEIRALSAFTAISKKINKQKQTMRFSIIQTEKNFDSALIISPKLSSLNSKSVSIFSISANFLLTSNFLPKQISILEEDSVEKYYNKPILLIKDIESVLKSIGKELSNSKDIIYSRLTKNFNINNFIASRRNLNQADIDVSNYISQNPQVFFEKNFAITKQPLKFDTNRWLIEQINQFKSDGCLCEILTDASEESYPLRKASVYNFYLYQIRSCLIRRFPPEKGEIGADQFIPSEAAFYWLMNPGKIVTNFVFLHDFLNNNYYKDFIDVTDIVAILKLIIQLACPNLDLEILCKIND
ncbi:hypothetical protein M9Y10_029083 [Tritrichomonas musculus]|uniref:VPS9 domain-containing protein n=1 Tax=Tritrichomonas musculus TaxID=1915356 RepID=A0ABR2KM99_9EUKA